MDAMSVENKVIRRETVPNWREETIREWSATTVKVMVILPKTARMKESKDRKEATVKEEDKEEDMDKEMDKEMDKDMEINKVESDVTTAKNSATLPEIVKRVSRKEDSKEELSVIVAEELDTLQEIVLLKTEF